MKIRKSMASLAHPSATAFSSLNIDFTEYTDLLFGVGSATSAGPTLPPTNIRRQRSFLAGRGGNDVDNAIADTFVIVALFSIYKLSQITDKGTDSNKCH